MRANGIEVSKDNPLVVEEELSIDGSQITSGKADAAFLIQPADTERIQSLLHNPGLRLMNFALEADAYANRFPAVVKVMLNRGAVEFSTRPRRRPTSRYCRPASRSSPVPTSNRR